METSVDVDGQGMFMSEVRAKMLRMARRRSVVEDKEGLDFEEHNFAGSEAIFRRRREGRTKSCNGPLR